MLKKCVVLTLLFGLASVQTGWAQSRVIASKACTSAGQADSYLLALSWQPAFCQSHRGKPECGIADAEVYHAKNFTLHGLWPNKQSCGIAYGYCGAITQPSARFCDYPAVALSRAVREQLAVVMPSVATNSCLERHEWHKHGTCANLVPDEYYRMAIQWVRQFNAQGIGAFMAANLDKTVSLRAFQNALNQGLGPTASRHVELICKAGLLVDVYLYLPKQIGAETSLNVMLVSGPQEPASSTCASGFRVDRIGQ